MYFYLVGCALTLLYILPVPVSGIKCATCRSNDHGCESGQIAPITCSPEHDKCYIYHIYVTNGGQGTMRGCSNQSFATEGCKGFRTRSYDGILCTHLCDWDGCNSAMGVGPRSSALIRRLTR